jgi:hypothetical protein
MIINRRIWGFAFLWAGIALSIAGLACVLVATFTDEDCDDALLVHARMDATQAPVMTSGHAAASNGAESDVAKTLASCGVAKPMLSLPSLAGLLAVLALALFALALWIARPWNRDRRVTYSGHRARR